MTLIAPLFFKLLIGHFIADYPLQGEFLAKAKNHKLPLPGVPFYQALLAHASIHAGMVWAITGSGLLAVGELLLHSLIDYLKCAGRASFNQDQVAHAICKLVYAIIVVI